MRKQPVTLFREAWIWSEKEEWLYKQLCEGSTLHVCCGTSRLGDIRVDLFAHSIFATNIKADAFHLPFKNESFNTVICDPPWFGPSNWSKWEKLVNELCRVAKNRIILVLGNLIYLLPKPWKLYRVYVLKKISPQIKVIYVWQKGIGD